MGIRQQPLNHEQQQERKGQLTEACPVLTGTVRDCALYEKREFSKKLHLKKEGKNTLKTKHLKEVKAEDKSI